MDQNFPVTEPPIEPPREEEVQPKLENVEEVAGVTPDVEAQPTVEIQVENGLDEERAAIKRKSEDERPEEFKKMFLADENTMQVDHVLNSLREVCEPAVETALNDGSGQSSSSSQSSETQPEFYAPQLYEPETEKMDDHKEETDYEEDDDPSPPQSQPNFITPELPTSDTIDIQEKLREMGEISVKPVSKNDPASTAKRKEGESEVSVEIKKKAASSVSDKFETEDSKRITNLRKNIREVMDENQLDATTLAAQRQESERLARVQVQQKIIRELQRQMAADRQNNRTQNRVLSLLQGQTSLMKSSTNADRSSTSQSGSSTDMYIVKGVASEVTFKGSNFVDVDKISSGNLTPSVSIAPVRRAKSIDEDSGSEEEKKEVVTIVDSSSEDDCIVLSDDDEEIEEEPEDDPHNSGLHVKDAYNIPDDQGRVVINIGHPESEDDIFLAPQIARIIKPHQIGGVRFLFDNIIESVERFDNSTGFGCILAHSMGLGKTLQIVCFCDIFLRHTSSKSVLCIMPINTLQNWMSEFNMWLPEDPEKTPLGTHGDVRPRNFKIFVLNDQHKTLSARSKVILEWSRVGGVLLIGYELYRLLSLKLANKKKKGKKGEKEKPETEAHKRLMEEIHSALVRPGPDLVICDEGHRIKNSHASISVALKQIRSKRRIVLTGYPLQNNLLEYWCMVDFVRPNYLGTKTEFANMFERPIQNGQCIDSTPQDIKLMRYRAHVLHSLLVGFVQRRSHVVLQNSLPQKEEYVILVRMTEFQRKLYDVFMNEVVRTKAVPNPLKAFAVCCKIWNHPDVLYNFLKKREADLDLELEEVEAEANATATTANTAAAANNRGRKKGPPKKAKEVNKDGKTIPAIEVQPNQGKIANENTESPTEEMTPKLEPEATPTTPEPQLDPPPLTQPPTQAPPDPEIPQQPPPMQNHHYPNNYNQYNPYECDGYYGQQYGSMYPPQPPQYPNHPYEQPYMPNPDNYWQGNYYGYGNTPNPIPLDPYGQVEPSYASLVPKATESFEKTKPPSAEEKSSEIVDLDTKEIKTVEPTIIEEVEEVKEPEPEIKEEAAEELAILPLEKETIRSNAKDDGIPYDWAVELMKGYVPDLLDNSPKMVIFFRLLEESLKLGDRILVFSQSLLTLNLIERFLQKSNVPGFDYHWAKNTTYFRLDGSTTAMEREKLINEFNSNPHIHLFLVSTRAGSLGINLVGANRVIVLDASWNPCHDTQAVCRVYRYGQKKPCFVYRIVMDNCLEKKIYDRQVNKQGMSDRVVDECNPDAHLSMKEVTNLCYDNEEDGEVKDFSDCKDKYLDIVMQKIIELHYSLLSKEPFHHESLLVDRKEKKLSQAEKRLAQRGYEMEKRATAKPAYVYHSMGTQYRVMRTPDGAIVHRPVASVRPMQAESGEKSQITRPGGVRPTRWIPAEVWQRQGMTAQEMTLPLDVVIPTSSGDKANIVLKAGQKVMVLKSPKGIYMQLETGKIIAIRTSFKMGQHNKDKSDDGEAGSSNLTSPEDLLLKATKGDQSSPIHHSASNFLLGNGNSKKDDLGKTNLNFPTGKHGYPFEATNRSSKLNESGLHGSSFKSQSNNMAPNRNYPQHSTPNSKHFNVQSLIEGKGSSSGQHNTNVYPHAKGNQNAEAMLPESNRSGNSFSGSSKSNLFNSTSKAHYPRSNYSFTNALKQAQTHGSQHSLLANVKPHIHENKLWEQQHKAQQALKNAVVQQPGAHAPPTITIDDDLEPPLREKVVYKPNLVERKPKMQNPRTLSQNFGKQSNKNTPPQTSGNLKGSGSDSLRQLQNVKPYNRQYPDQRNGSTTQPKPIEETPPVQQAAPSPAPPVADVKSSPRPKMPAIRNIPAPYPSICVPHINSTATPTTTQSTSSYAQSNLTASSQDIGQHSSRSVPPSFTGHNTQQRQENSEYSLGRSSDKKPENLEPTKNSRPASETVTPKDKKLSAKQPPASAAPPPPAVIPAATIQPAAPTSATPPQTTSSAILDPQYPNYNQPAASTNLYAPPPAVSNDPNYNYSRPEPAPYQQPYPDIYGSAPTNNYAYPPAQHQPPPQSNYPYGSYYDPQMYGNMPATNSTPNYGNSVPPPPPPTQHQPGQFHPYPNYHQPPSAAPPHTPDPYNSYYNYPPYPPQTGQWQQ